MARTEHNSHHPARLRRGLPVIHDGSKTLPILLRLPDSESTSACNNGCENCLSTPVVDDHSAWGVDVAEKHVVIRDREPLLRRDLPSLLRQLHSRRPASISILTNGRLLIYPKVVKSLLHSAPVRFIVKLFGTSAEIHDARTRVQGSFAQAVQGMSMARSLGAKVLITFPGSSESARDSILKQSFSTFAREFTSHEDVEFPEPQVSAHASEYRYDVVHMSPHFSPADWSDSFLPMVHVHTGPVCNIRCTYCNVRGGDDQRLFSLNHMKTILDSAASSVLGKQSVGNNPTIDFIGGEPTLHPDLPKFISYARELGFNQVTICTNGTLLHRPGYLDSLIRAGLTGIRYSFHEHRSDEANKLADSPNLGDRYIDVAKLLLGRKDLKTYIYRILLASNLDSLQDYIRFIHSHNSNGVPLELTLGMPSLRGRMNDNSYLYPPLNQIREYVAQAVELSRRLGIKTTIHHAAGCLLPGSPGMHACLNVVTTQYDGLTGDVLPIFFEGDTRYGKACESCEGKKLGCYGIPAVYFQQNEQQAEGWMRPF